MKKEGLDPKSNDTVVKARFSGGFGQPDGFESILTVSVNRHGNATFHLAYKIVNTDQSWAVILDNDQRRELIRLLSEHEPTLWVYDIEKGGR